MKKSSFFGIGRRHRVQPGLCVVVFVLMTASLSLATQGKIRVRKPRTAQTATPAQSPAIHRPGLPFDRVIRPGLERQLPHQAASVRHGAIGNPYGSSATTSSEPNFGGFLAASTYQAYDASGQDNSPLIVFASGDFNKDGKADLATVQASGTVNVLLNQGKGSFGAPVTTPPSNVGGNVGGVVQAIALDVNNDGYDDLLLLDAVNNSVDVMLNKGDGTFAAPQLYSVSNNLVASMATGDVNGDGFPDIVLVSSSETYNSYGTITTTIEVDTLLNNGKGGFLAPTSSQKLIFTLSDEYDTLWGRSVALADVNGDGIPDVTLETLHWLDNPTPTEDSEHVIMTMIGTGGGTFLQPIAQNYVVIPSLSTFNPGYPLVANLNLVDINKDGFEDIVFSYQDYFIWAALGNGNGTYQPYYNVGAYHAYPTDLMTADINGNGLPDLIDAEPGWVGVYTNLGSGKFDNSVIPSYGSGLGASSVLSIADFNGDGTPDAAVMNSVQGTVTIFTGVPGTTSSLHAAPLLNPQTGNVGGVISQAVLDTNGDGFDDIVFYNTAPYVQSASLMTALGDGKGNFFYQNALPGYVPSADDFIDPVTGDFNGDGLNDLILHTDQGVSVLLSNGDGTFTAHPLPLGSFSCITARSAIGDLNGDGKLDLVIAYYGDAADPGCNNGTTPSGVFVLLGNGDGTFQNAKFIPVGEEVWEPFLIDTRNNGKLDLVISDVPLDLQNYEGQTVSYNTFLMLGNGDGTFQKPTTLVANNINAHTMAGDVNGDGKADLVILTEGNVDSTGTLDPTTAGVLILLAKGDGSYTPQPLFLPGFYSSGGLLTDINGDGKLDLVLSEFTSYDFTDAVGGGVAALGNGDGTFTPVSNFEGGDSSSLILQGNFLQDASPDTVFVSSVSGSSLVLNQGGTAVTLTAKPTSIEQGQSVSITAVVTATMAGRPQPTGTVTVSEGSTSLGSGTLSSDGSTSISVSGLTAGTHTITAVYSGDANFNVNSGASVSVQVTTPPPPPPPPSVAVTGSTSSILISPGNSGIITYTAVANASYSGNLSFTVTGAPAGMTASFTPGQITLAPSQSLNAVLVIGTTTNSSQLKWPKPASGGASLAALLLLAIRRRLRRKLSSLALSLIGAIALAGLLGFAGCSGGSGVKITPAGTSTLTITATPANLPAQVMHVSVTVL
jgi:hypothetical protein